LDGVSLAGQSARRGWFAGGTDEPHVSLAQVYYRLRRKQEGDREREIVQKLKAEQDAQQSKAKGDAQTRP